MNNKGSIGKFIWRISYAHVLAYFLAGILVFNFIDYTELYPAIMRPTTDPIVSLGLSLQIFRGALLALAIYPIRKVFLGEKHGYIKLGGLMLALSLLLTIGPSIGSFDGYIYTIIPAHRQMFAYPEAILYILLFIGILKLSDKYDKNKLTLILPIISVIFVVFAGVMGALFA